MRLPAKVLFAALATLWSLPLLWVMFCSFNLHLLGGVPSAGDLILTTSNFSSLQHASLADAAFNSTWIGLGSAILGTSAALLISFGLLCRPVPMMMPLMIVFSGRTLPPIVFLLPQYLFFRKIGIGSSRWALLLVDAFTAMSLCLIFISPFLLRLHYAFFEQIQIDGASSYTYFLRVLLPQLQGPILFSFIAAFMLSWSDFLFAGVFVVSEHTRTLPVLISSFLTSYGTAWGPMYAALCVALLGACTLVGMFLLGRAILLRTGPAHRKG